MEWLRKLLLELKAQLSLRGWGAAAWLSPGGVILPWSVQPCHVTLQLVPLTGLIAAGEPIEAVDLCYGSSDLGSWGGNWARWAKVTLVQCCGHDCSLWISPLVSQISEVTDIGGFVPDLGRRRLESQSRTL